ncbi:hypothetical protein QTP70_016587 [Hemibagrus guttatus]|uniref:Tenascin-R n=1 Tax=Hemibagrus guttatus TaxID=175788 RepID=A0AAE0R804_9TELE|nr:hypothetical protein QTP70_016587 [Hemibagrus guttatus]
MPFRPRAMMCGSIKALCPLMSLALLFLCIHAVPAHKDKTVWTARIKRQATDANGNTNNQSQPMIFNHVYNINVPLESLCSVDLDSKGSTGSDKSGEEYEEESMDSDSQVTFTHRINIPKAACSCPASAMLQQLASRIEMLEREVSLLRTQCSACCGDNLVLALQAELHGMRNPQCYGMDPCSGGLASCGGAAGKCLKWRARPCRPDGREACHSGGHLPESSDSRLPATDGRELIPIPSHSMVGTSDGSPVLGNKGGCLGGLQLELRVQGNVTNTTINKLEPGLEYNINVYTVIDNVISVPVSTVASTYLSNPDGLIFKSITETSVEVQWQPFDYLFDGWEISFIPMDNNGGMTTQLPSTITSYNQTGLMPGEEYTVNLVALKDQGRSQPVTATVTTLIDGPTQLMIRDVSDTVAFVEWTLPRAKVDEIILQYGIVGYGEPMTTFHLEPSLSQYSLQVLRPGTRYKVLVSSFYKGNESRIASVEFITGVFYTDNEFKQVPLIQFLVCPLFFTEIDPPKHLRVLSKTSTSLELEWDNSKTVVQNYYVVYSTLAGDQYNKVIIPRGSGATTKTTLTNLQPGTEYGIGISAILGTNQSNPATMNARTGLDTPMDLMVTASTENSITLVWGSVQGPIEYYRVSYTSASGVTTEITVPRDISSTTLSGLEPGTEYTITVMAQRGRQQSTAATIDAFTGFRPVSQLYFSDITSDSLVVSWSAPAPPADSFNLHYSTDDSNEESEVVLDGSKTRTVLSGLLPSRKYIVTLVTMHGDTASEPVISTIVTGMDPPREIMISYISEDSVTISWAQPLAQFDYYKMSYQSARGQMDSVVIDKDVTNYTLTRLHPATEYEIKLNTVRGSQESKQMSTSVFTAMDMPIELMALNVTPQGALLRWTPPRSNVDNYVLTLTRSQVYSDLQLTNEVFLLTSDSRNISSGREQAGTSVESSSPQHSLLHRSLCQQGPFNQWHCDHQLYHTDPGDLAMSCSMDAPQNLTASEVNHRSALISWQPPIADIDNYMLTYKSSDGSRKELIMDAEDTWIRLEGLAETTEYTVRLQAARGLETSAIVSTSFTTGNRLFALPQNCAQHLLNGELLGGVYTVYINRDPSQGVQVYCDMTTDGGGWIVFQRRQNGLTEFSRKWSEYRTGFGNLEDEFWLGLENLHKITAQGRYELRIDMRNGQDAVYANYDRFSIGDSRSLYKLRIGEYNGTAGDSLSYHHGRPFSTKDKDNDNAVTNCALSYKGAWWYKNCHRVNLNGKYGESRHSQGINWHMWKGHEFSIPFVEMKMRPYNYRSISGKRRRSTTH